MPKRHFAESTMQSGTIFKWRWLYGSGNQCHHHATYIVRTDDRLLEEQLFEEGNILHGKKHDQEMVRQFFSYMRVN